MDCSRTDSDSYGLYVLPRLFSKGLEEILQKIFLYLDPKSLKNSKQTCNQWREFIDRISQQLPSSLTPSNILVEVGGDSFFNTLGVLVGLTKDKTRIEVAKQFLVSDHSYCQYESDIQNCTLIESILTRGVGSTVSEKVIQAAAVHFRRFITIL